LDGVKTSLVGDKIEREILVEMLEVDVGIVDHLKNLDNKLNV
jgi:hypothetical protein